MGIATLLWDLALVSAALSPGSPLIESKDMKARMLTKDLMIPGLRGV